MVRDTLPPGVPVKEVSHGFEECDGQLLLRCGDL